MGGPKRPKRNGHCDVIGTAWSFHASHAKGQVLHIPVGCDQWPPCGKNRNIGLHMPPLSLWNSRTNRWSGPENFEISQKLLMSRITGPLKSMEMIHANSSNLGCQWLDQRFGHAHFHVPIWINSSDICLRNTFPHLWNLSIYLPIYLSIYLSIHLSIYINFHDHYSHDNHDHDCSYSIITLAIFIIIIIITTKIYIIIIIIILMLLLIPSFTWFTLSHLIMSPAPLAVHFGPFRGWTVWVGKT